MALDQHQLRSVALEMWLSLIQKLPGCCELFPANCQRGQVQQHFELEPWIGIRENEV